ncbi:MAG: glycosyltransferase family 4 protein [Deltaproteobacteria bacterium]|uniref:glycosyltransferase family 4 protein n=1 Tax=Desulfobacula sp. TaxID=2593537 RepID=UPI0019B69268|nr:glycosyltransferase family 4 protein [Candidatus Desulfobacula maris]MBL6995760.1 glycosyltransferase family 4 protein [Desulfobacula sp.]
MKIVHILKGKADPNTLNGVNKVVHHLATEQLRLNHNVEVWGIASNPAIIRHQHDYPLHLFSANKNRFFINFELKNKINSLPRNTIAHLHSVFLPELYAVGMALKKASIPFVLTPHGGYSPQSRKKKYFTKSIYMALFEKRLLSEAHKLHAIGQSEVNDLFILAPSKSIVLLPNGQDLKEVMFTPTKTLLPIERPVFGYCGRLAKNHKGLDLLIKGFSQYKKTGGNGELWLIGDGPDKHFLKKLVRKEKVNNFVKFLGEMFGDIKLSHFSKMDVFVHPSRWDGIPMAVLEAAAIGKPLIVSQATNMGDFIIRYDNGIVLNENYPLNISKAMHKFNKLITNHGIKKIGANSIKLVKNELNWRTIAKQTISTLYL